MITQTAALGILLVACSPLTSIDETNTLDGRTIRCDVLVVGGSFGGCAAALGASGLDVWVIEESPWIGGQVTSQGVSALERFSALCSGESSGTTGR
ncbi:MAG: FAD-dependent oxidoreductase [Planctomycetota bacterium]|nr:FAD-dependent oxidoreductase [Planctomycetota bacterium]